jgi:uncharacterized membrane protein
LGTVGLGLLLILRVFLIGIGHFAAVRNFVCIVSDVLATDGSELMKCNVIRSTIKYRQNKYGIDG